MLRDGEEVILYSSGIPYSCKEATLIFNENGELAYTTYEMSSVTPGDGFSMVAEYEFFNYGTTVVPEVIIPDYNGATPPPSSSSSTTSGSLINPENAKSE